jgi:hypothetical protein
VGNAPTGSVCRLTQIPSGVFKSTPGTVTLVLTSTKGNVAFNAVTDVVDSKNKTVPSINTGNILSFDVTAGEAYSVRTLYTFLPPDSTGVLREGCPDGVILSYVDALTNPQKFTVMG